MQVIGLCRFSYPALGGFQVEHDDPATRAAYLYAPDRMEARFRTFEAFTLPGLRAQTDPDFTFLIVVGDDLPAAWRTRLDRLTADIPQVVIQAHPPGPHRKVMQAAINSVRDKGRITLQYRLDDDDGVAVEFTARLRAEAAAQTRALTGNRHIAIDFRDGFIAAPGPEGLRLRRTTAPFMTAALAVMFEPDVQLTVMNFSHVKLEKFMTCVPVGGPPMYLRGYGDWNDSRQDAPALPDDLRPPTPEEEALIRARFGVDVRRVRAIFSA
ncbi:glycosyltransferase [Pseudooceanicola onchidii]|uniref:glycosyltransferase n=1 Tax=Pseudooceanicola onchidii TaxID=2562279 RepID=UPI0010AB3F3C|nr:glycosyltransferase [Pseudooceanicola onchidii]